MYTSVNGSSTGYESITKDRLAHTSMAKRPQISDAQLKVLPAFAYDGKQRFEFAESLKRLISTWRLVFLITNEKASSLQRQEADRNARGATPVTFFSPRDQKGREGSRIEDDDLRPDPRGMASALYGSIKQAEGPGGVYLTI